MKTGRRWSSGKVDWGVCGKEGMGKGRRRGKKKGVWSVDGLGGERGK